MSHSHFSPLEFLGFSERVYERSQKPRKTEYREVKLIARCPCYIKFEVKS